MQCPCIYPELLARLLRAGALLQLPPLKYACTSPASVQGKHAWASSWFDWGRNAGWKRPHVRAAHPARVPAIQALRTLSFPDSLAPTSSERVYIRKCCVLLPAGGQGSWCGCGRCAHWCGRPPLSLLNKAPE